MRDLDPTREDMLAYLAHLPGCEGFEEFDREEAVYWFANDWHGGQWSNLYAALCASPFKPGPNALQPHGGAQYLYQELEAEFTDAEEEFRDGKRPRAKRPRAMRIASTDSTATI